MYTKNAGGESSSCLRSIAYLQALILGTEEHCPHAPIILLSLEISQGTFKKALSHKKLTCEVGNQWHGILPDRIGSRSLLFLRQIVFIQN